MEWLLWFIVGGVIGVFAASLACAASKPDGEPFSESYRKGYRDAVLAMTNKRGKQ